MSDLVIVGAGPAGLAAAYEAARLGGTATLLDMQPNVGGQIWRSTNTRLIQKVNEFIHSGRVKLMSSATVFDVQGHHLLVDHKGKAELVHWEKLILACGARDLCLPFPGWTLPDVYSIGGLQALIKTGLDVRDKRIAIAGSGPLLMALLKTATEKGAEVVLFAEQTPLRKWLKFGQKAAMQKPDESVGFAPSMLAARKMRWSAWPSAITAKDDLKLTLRTKKGLEDIACDIAAVSFGLVPNLELADLLGCETTPDHVVVSPGMETSRPGIYAAGEQTGIAGSDCAIAEGRIAARTALGEDASRFIKEAKRDQVLKQAIIDGFPLQTRMLEEYRSASPIFCRCENVAQEGWEDRSFAEVKLQTRIGMGPCQGRFCGAAHQALFGRGVESPRPPIFPVLAGTYAEALGALREEGIHAKD